MLRETQEYKDNLKSKGRPIEKELYMGQHGSAAFVNLSCEEFIL